MIVFRGDFSIAFLSVPRHMFVPVAPVTLSVSVFAVASSNLDFR